LASSNITASTAILQQEQAFVTTQPLGIDRVFTTQNMTTSAIAMTFPFITSELTMDKGILYGLNLHNNSLVIFDRFSLENANSVIFAKSGAGKSYFVKLEAIRSLMFGAEIIIVDPEKEYERLCEAVNGTYISFSQDKGHKMNPFELSGMGDPNEDELRMKILSLQGFFRILFGGLNNIEQAVLDRALLLTYREKGITLDPASQRNNKPPLLEDLYKVLKGMADPEAREMSQRLEQYIMGSGARIFNEASNVEINNPFTVFSVRDLQEELRPIAMYLMLDYIWTKVRKDRKRRILIIDEAWYMMLSDDSANFMYSIAKRARKYYLGVTTVTQEVEDFTKHDKGQAIINNASMLFLMKQSNTAANKLKDVFELSEGERNYLTNCVKGQGIFFAGQSHVAMQVVSSVAEHDLITSDPKELEIIENRKENPSTIKELGSVFAPPVMHNPLQSNSVQNTEKALSSALEAKKSEIQEIFDERLTSAEEDIAEEQKK
jgi:type IV secretory pathway VirB4 component